MKLPQPITSRTNARVKALRAGFSGKSAKPGELVGIEGENLLLEALQSGIAVESVFVRQGSEALLSQPGLRSVSPANVVVLSSDVFASAVDTASPQGVAAVVRIPEIRPPDDSVSGVVLLLEAMQDPGNLGTLLRTAEAFGVAQVFATPDSVIPWNPKTVRASAGSVFRVPVRRTMLDEAQRTLKDNGVRLYAAVAEGEGATACMDADLTRACALMIGNEGAGLSAAALALADVRIHIPCATESLNAAVAGTVLMYEVMRQRTAVAAREFAGGHR